jgi:hypothetical protein
MAEQYMKYNFTELFVSNFSTGDTTDFFDFKTTEPMAPDTGEVVLNDFHFTKQCDRSGQTFDDLAVDPNNPNVDPSDPSAGFRPMESLTDLLI